MNERRKMNEQEIEELESLTHFIKYLNLRKDVKNWELWDGMKRLEEFATKAIVNEYRDEDLKKYGNLQSSQEMVENFMERLLHALEEK